MSSFAIRIDRRRRRYAFTCALLGGLACAALAGPSPALAQSGEVEGTEGVFFVPGQQCDDLRDLVDGQDDGNADFNGNVIVVCDGGDPDNEFDRSACEIISGSQTVPGTNAGQGVGFCADRFDTVELIERGTLKEDVTVLATSFGSVVGTTELTEFSPYDSLEHDTVCETFAPPDDPSTGAKACRRVVQLGDGETPPGEFPTCDVPEFPSPLIITPADPSVNADACNLIADQLAGAVTEVDPTNLSFALFIDIDKLSQPGSEALFVCPGRRLECGDIVGVDATVQYQIPKLVVLEEPDCIRIRGRRLCPKRP